MGEIELKLTVDEVNVVLDALGHQPFASVYQLVNKIQQQASGQLGGGDGGGVPDLPAPEAPEAEGDGD